MCSSCTSHFGRRRPFLIGFGCLACIGILLVYSTISFADNKLALATAIVGVQIMDWGLDSLSAPSQAESEKGRDKYRKTGRKKRSRGTKRECDRKSRPISDSISKAYTLDCITIPSQQSKAINIRMVLCGIGGSIGFALAGFLGISHFKLLGVITVFIFITSLVLTLLSLKETVYIIPFDQDKISINETLRLFIGMIRTTPNKLFILCFCDIFNWASFGAFMTYFTGIQ